MTTSWVEGAAGSGFDVDHLPFGVCARPGADPRVHVRIGDQALDVASLAADARPDVHAVVESSSLNSLLGAGRPVWDSMRAWLTQLLGDESERSLVQPHLAPLDELQVRMPVQIGDYVDFYASLDHATNVGRIFRPDSEPLLPNWRHLPVGYHGRGGTVVPSGTPIVRPHGQRVTPGAAGAPVPEFGPSTRLDIEAELGFVIGTGSTLGQPVPASDLAEHVFGVVGLNDWSARDIQAWEYVPLGPFLGKSFATSVSAWVTPLAALEAAWIDLPAQDPEPLPYLAPGVTRGLDIDVEVVLNGEVVSRPPYRTMYWSPAQMLAHLTANGASVRPGDLFASGTISGPDPDQRGSLLELTWGGRDERPGGGTFLEDGDEVVLRYSAPGTGGGRLTLGEVASLVLPAR